MIFNMHINGPELTGQLNDDTVMMSGSHELIIGRMSFLVSIDGSAFVTFL